jgi:hypothetical protein
MRRRFWTLGVVVAAGAAVYATAGPPPPLAAPAGSFAFAVLGDSPYYGWEDLKYRIVLQDLRAHDLRFVLHVGDMLWRPCSDARFRSSFDGFNSLPQPVVYTPGDNEWTDCWEEGAGRFDPLERLGRLRQMFFAKPVTLGGRRLALETQGGRAPFDEFVEHVRWGEEGLVFATVHLVGSENANEVFPGRTPKNDEEVVRRTAAATEWLRETFAAARASKARAIVLGFHANPALERPADHSYRQHFEPFLSALEEEAEAFARPVLVVQGDDHEYTVDHPLIRRTTGRTIENLTRLQVPGSPAVGWVRVVVSGDTVPAFSSDARVVPGWKYW